VRGSIFDIFRRASIRACGSISSATSWKRCACSIPTPSARRQRSIEHLLLPASEALLDEDSVKRFRTRYRELFGAKATEDPLYQAISDGRRLAGMEHWLPLFEDRLVTLFDHLGEDDLVVIDSAPPRRADERFDDIADYFTARSDTSAKRPAATARSNRICALPDGARNGRRSPPAGRSTAPILRPARKRHVIDFGFSGAGDFAPERARGDNAYEAAAKHLHASPSAGRKAIIAAYTEGSRARIASILGEAQAPAPRMAESWQEALGLAAKGRPPRWSCRSKPDSPMPRWNWSPSRTSSATGWFAARSAARTPMPSLPNCPR
jgi:transcription-repair coupling factor (superfamily II helicase)